MHLHYYETADSLHITKSRNGTTLGIDCHYHSWGQEKLVDIELLQNEFLVRISNLLPENILICEDENAPPDDAATLKIMSSRIIIPRTTLLETTKGLMAVPFLAKTTAFKSMLMAIGVSHCSYNGNDGSKTNQSTPKKRLEFLHTMNIVRTTEQMQQEQQLLRAKVKGRDFMKKIEKELQSLGIEL